MRGEIPMRRLWSVVCRAEIRCTSWEGCVQRHTRDIFDGPSGKILECVAQSNIEVPTEKIVGKARVIELKINLCCLDGSCFLGRRVQRCGLLETPGQKLSPRGWMASGEIEESGDSNLKLRLLKIVGGAAVLGSCRVHRGG